MFYLNNNKDRTTILTGNLATVVYSERPCKQGSHFGGDSNANTAINGARLTTLFASNLPAVKFRTAQPFHQQSTAGGRFGCNFYFYVS
jgi:hypothetical protein